MYYFIEIIFLISSVTSLKLVIDRDLYLGPELTKHYDFRHTGSSSRKELVSVSARRLPEPSASIAATSLESTEASSDGSGETTITNTRTTTKQQNPIHNTVTTTAFTTKFERGTTRQFKGHFRAHHHKQHQKNVKEVKNIAFTLPQWPSMPWATDSYEIPTIYPKTNSTAKSHQYFASKFTQILDWVEIINNKTNIFNIISNKTNELAQIITNKTQLIGNKVNELVNDANKWQDSLKNKTSSLSDPLNQFGGQVNNWTQEFENKTNEIKNKTQMELEDKLNQYNKDVNAWQQKIKNITKLDETKELNIHETVKNITGELEDGLEEIKNKYKDIASDVGIQIGNLIDQAQYKGQELQNLAKDKQKEIENKFNNFGNQTKDVAKEQLDQAMNKFTDVLKGASALHDQAKKKEIEGNFGNRLDQAKNKFSDWTNGLSKWQNHAKDKQIEIKDKINNFDSQVKVGDKVDGVNDYVKWVANVKYKGKDFLDNTNGEVAQQVHNWKTRVNISNYKIKDDKKIAYFTKHILTRTLNVFHKVRRLSNEYHWQKKLNRLAKNYKDKYKDFLRSTAHQVIKTRLGTQKVIINAIDVSKTIVERLVNIMIDDMDKKGLLRSSHTQDIFYREMKKEVDSEMHYACLVLGICINRSGFTQTVLDVLTNMNRLDDVTFKQAFDSLTEAAKYANVSRSLGKASTRGLKRKIGLIENEDVNIQRAMIMIIKNIVANRNKPLVLNQYSDPEESNLNTTLTFLEVLDTLDQNVPDSEENMKMIYHIRSNMNGWVHGNGVQNTMTKFVALILKALDDLNGIAWNSVRSNAKILFA